MICSSDTEEDEDWNFKSNFKLKATRKVNKSTKNIFDENEFITTEQKASLRKLLQRFENRKLPDKELRILQGILLKDFGDLEHRKKLDKALKKAKAELVKETNDVIANLGQERIDLGNLPIQNRNSHSIDIGRLTQF